MTQPTETITSLSRSFFIFCVLQVFLLCLVISGAGVGLAGVFGAQTSEPGASLAYLAIYSSVIAALAPILLILGSVAGFALRAKKRWGRVVAVLTAIVSLLEIPVGSAFGIYWLVRLLRKPVAA